MLIDEFNHVASKILTELDNKFQCDRAALKRILRGTMSNSKIEKLATRTRVADAIRGLSIVRSIIETPGSDSTSQSVG